MLKLIQVEFLKLRRRKFIWLMLLAALFMPLAAVFYFASVQGTGVEPIEFYKWTAFSYTPWIILPVVLGMLSTMLMYNENQYDMLKQLWIVPVNKMAYFFGKFAVVLVYSVCFMLITAAASILTGVLPGYIAFDSGSVLYLLRKCVEISLLTAFAVQIPIFSVISDGSFKSLILPSAAMAFPIICIAARVLRAAVLNELKSDYVTYARARGFSNAQIVYGEVLRNALPAAITLFAQYCAALFGTSALVESVFSIQGLGIYLMDSCESMDIYGISGSILVCGVLFVLFNTLADLLSSAICPAYRRKAV